MGGRGSGASSTPPSPSSPSSSRPPTPPSRACRDAAARPPVAGRGVVPLAAGAARDCDAAAAGSPNVAGTLHTAGMAERRFTRGDGMKQLELSPGTVRYRDSGEGPPIVFVHGVLVDGTLWRNVTPPLEGRFRCIVPDWPLGSHTLPMKPEADITPRGVSRLIGELLEALDLSGATLVANDTGGALTQMLAVERPERIARIVLTPCDCFD